MRIFLRSNPDYTGELYRMKFQSGLSLDHGTDTLFNALKVVAGYEPEWVKDEPCENCQKLQLEIDELKRKKK